MPWSWLIPAVFSAGSSLIGGSGAQDAANTQADAANHAADVQLQMFNQTRSDLNPFINFGQGALPGLGDLLGYGAGGTGGTGGTPGTPESGGQPDWTQLLKDRPDVQAEYDRLLPTIDWNSPWAAQHGFTQGGGPEQFAQWWYGNNKNADDPYKVPLTPKVAATPGTPGTPGQANPNAMRDALRNTPGYQFQLGEGLNAVLSKSTATGGVGGGNTLKGLMTFGQGLADSTYEQRVQDLMAAAGLGENAAAGLGNNAVQTGNNIGNYLTQAGNAGAAGIAGQTQMYQNFLANLTRGGGGGGGGGGIPGMDPVTGNYF